MGFISGQVINLVIPKRLRPSFHVIYFVLDDTVPIAKVVVVVSLRLGVQYLSCGLTIC